MRGEFWSVWCDAFVWWLLWLTAVNFFFEPKLVHKYLFCICNRSHSTLHHQHGCLTCTHNWRSIRACLTTDRTFEPGLPVTCLRMLTSAVSWFDKNINAIAKYFFFPFKNDCDKQKIQTKCTWMKRRKTIFWDSLNALKSFPSPNNYCVIGLMKQMYDFGNKLFGHWNRNIRTFILHLCTNWNSLSNNEDRMGLMLFIVSMILVCFVFVRCFFGCFMVCDKISRGAW